MCVCELVAGLEKVVKLGENGVKFILYNKKIICIIIQFEKNVKFKTRQDSVAVVGFF